MRADVSGTGSPPWAIVMGLSTTGLGIARALGRAGVPVVGVDGHRRPAARSRWLRFVRSPGDAGPADLLFYLELADRLGGRPVLLPSSEAQVGFLVRYVYRLLPAFRFQLGAPDLLERLMSKRRFAALCEARGVLAPRTVIPADAQELRHAAGALRYPCIVKPEFGDAWRRPEIRRLGHGEPKAITVSSAPELIESFERFARIDPRLVVQERIEGCNASYQALVAPDGTTYAEFAGHKLRLAPPYNGAGSLVASTDDPALVDAGRHALAALGFTGIADVDLVRDDRDGRYHVLEINPRFSQWVGLAVACGVNLPLLYHRACLGERSETPPGWVVGRRWVNLLPDARAMATYARDGQGTWGEWLRSTLAADVHAVMALSDPVPGLLDIARAARRHASSAARRTRPRR